MTECSFDGCARGAESRGLCGSHYAQQRAGRRLEPIRPYRARADLSHIPAEQRRQVIQAAHAYDLEHDDALALLMVRFCMVCHRTPTGLSIDHDHSTGSVRGVLCGDCNRAIGLFRDDPELMRRAADYVERPPISGHRRRPRETS